MPYSESSFIRLLNTVKRISIKVPLRDYINAINDKQMHGDATEHTLRPVLESLLRALSKDSVVTNEPKRIAVGAPDFVIRRKISKTQYLPIGWIETKDINANLDDIEKTEQIKRYLPLGNLILTNYIEFRWYVDGKLRTADVLAERRKDKFVLLTEAETTVGELLREFLEHKPSDISKPEILADRMAKLCRQIDRIIVNSFNDNRVSELLAGLKGAFERTLLPDLSPEQFADMFTQTLAYGLFAARVNHYREAPAQEFRRSEAAKEIPKTNPFLRKLFDTINGADIEDEPFIGFVDDLTAVMQYSDIGTILQHFGRKTGQEDPVVHFYETFLAAYDPKLRELRGVYYTPEPVVSYIVRSVDILLKEKFGLVAGLADKSTVEVEVEENGEKVKKILPKVLILDPACGTGTFLYAVINLIRQKFMNEGNAGEWSDFVRDHLLPRVFGFELLMAPYAVAHLKLAMQLSAQDLDEPLRSKWAYDFASDERLNVYLTNSLEMTEHQIQTAIFGVEKQIAEEANAAHNLKTELPIMVVLGNPPYSGHSANKNDWIDARLKEAYYQVDGKPLGERNPKWLQDDYVKFIRFGQWRIEQTGYGILAYISNHGYLDNPTFRGMRQSLMDSFDELYLMDLHGNSKKKERAPDGGKDENVFDIQQGVAIGLFVKQKKRAKKKTIMKSDLFGKREDKYDQLSLLDVARAESLKLSPNAPFYLFTARDETLASEYEHYWKINDAMPVNSAGIVTARDDLTIGWTEEEVVARIKNFAELSEDEAREKYELGEDSDWSVRAAQEDVRTHGDIENLISPILYRPFDVRYVCYTGEAGGITTRPRTEVMEHMLLVRENVGLITVRRFPESSNATYFFASRSVISNGSIRSDNQSIDMFFPLYIQEESESEKQEQQPRALPNFSIDFRNEFYRRFPPEKLNRTIKGKPLNGPWVNERDIFNYIYAIFHSPTYRSRYAEFLKMDFPRVPITSDREIFKKLVKLGGELVKLHLMETPPNPLATRGGEVRYPEKGDHKVERVNYLDDKQQVWINKTQYFEGVPNSVWEFHIGGYQVAEKWLKDRKGRVLTAEDREHYRKIIYSLAGTIELMKQIDEAIPSWPLD